LHIIEIISNHHLKNHEEFSVGDVTIVVDVIDLESESEFLFLSGSSRKRIKTLHELKEGDASILVLVQDSNDSLDQWIICKL
jgi:hypothetical protein